MLEHPNDITIVNIHILKIYTNFEVLEDERWKIR